MIYLDIVNPEHPRSIITIVNGKIVPKDNRPISSVIIKDKLVRLVSFLEENYCSFTVRNTKKVINEVIQMWERSFRSYTLLYNKYKNNKDLRSTIIRVLLYDFYDVLDLPNEACRGIEFSSATYYKLSWEHQILVDDMVMCALNTLSRVMVNNCASSMAGFLYYLEGCGINDIHMITEKIIREFKRNNNVPPCVLGRIKCMLREYAIIHSDQIITEILQWFPTTGNITKAYQPMSKDERSMLENFLLDPSSNISKRDRAIGILIFYTGPRCADVSKINKTDINLSTCELHVIQQKTGTHLHIPLLPVISNAIIDYVVNERPNVDSPLLFLPTHIRKNKNIPPRNISAIMNSIYDKVGIMRRGAHMLRHEVANKMINESVDIATISSILGHTNISTTERYISANVEQLRACSLPIKQYPINSKLYDDFK